LKEQDNNNIDIGESNNRKKEVASDENTFDCQTRGNEEEIKTK